MAGSSRAEAPSSRPLEVGQRTLVHRAARIMATDVSVQIATPPERQAWAEEVAEACMAWMRAVDDTLSRFNPASELSRLNAGAGEWFAASDLLYEAVETALHAARASNGLFDPTLLTRLEALGYDRDFSLIERHEVASPPENGLSSPPPPLSLPSAREPGPTVAPLAPPSSVGKGAGGLGSPAQGTTPLWRDISLDPDGRRIRLPQGARLDLGGIAKGWAADIALERLCHDCEHALINVGGDLRLRGGPQPGQAWTTGVFDPRAEASGASSRYAAVVTMSRGGLATSGSVRRWWLRDGVRRHHLLDPRTGAPARVWIDQRDDADAGCLIATATALAPTSARAEVAAKVALLRGYPDALRIVEANWARHGALGPAGDADAAVALLLVLGDGQVILSQNFEDYLASWGTAGAALPLRTPLPGAREGRV